MTAVHPVRGRLAMQEYELEMWKHYPIYIVVGIGFPLLLTYNRDNAEKHLERVKIHGEKIMRQFPLAFPEEEIPELTAQHQIIEMQGPALAELLAEHGIEVSS